MELNTDSNATSGSSCNSGNSGTSGTSGTEGGGLPRTKDGSAAGEGKGDIVRGGLVVGVEGGALAVEELIRRARTALIRYPQFRELHSKIRECHEVSQLSNEPQCASLEGPTGAGKSTLAMEYAKAFPRRATPSGVEIPVLYIQTPSPVSVKGMVSTMLAAMGDPAAYRGTLQSLNARLLKLLEHCRVRLMILDDFHHLISAGSDQKLKIVSDWLKVLVKESRVPVLVIGIEGGCEAVLRSNPQLARLFACRERLEPFAWDVKRPETIRNYDQFTRLAEDAVGLSLRTGLDRVDLLFRMHYATDGVVAHHLNLLRYAQLLALKAARDHITLQDLETSYQERLARIQAGKDNPFRSAGAARLASRPPGDTAAEAPEGEGGQGRRTGKSGRTRQGDSGGLLTRLPPAH